MLYFICYTLKHVNKKKNVCKKTLKSSDVVVIEIIPYKEFVIDKIYTILYCVNSIDSQE